MSKNAVVSHGPTLKRKVNFGGREYVVFGNAPWTIIPVDAVRDIPACWIVIEASLLSYALNRNRHMYNALSSMSSKGAYIGVAFVGADGKAKAAEVAQTLNFKFG